MTSSFFVALIHLKRKLQVITINIRGRENMRRISDLSIDVGRRLKEIQSTRPEITDEDIAGCIGTTVQMVKAYKRGYNLMPLTSCVDLIQAFKIDPRFLILGDPTVPIFMEDDDFYVMSDTEKCRMHVYSLVELLKKLPPSRQVECLGILMTEVGKGLEL